MGDRKLLRRSWCLVARICLVSMGCAAAVNSSAWAGETDGEEPSHVFAAPENFSACQVGYGADGGVLRLSWTNSESFEEIQVYLDAELVADLSVDGAHQSTEVSVPLGSHDLEIQGFVGDFSSEPASLSFDIVQESPVTDPVTSLDCEYIEGGAGQLLISWATDASSSEWNLGEVRMGGRRGNIEFGPDDSPLDIMLDGDRVEGVTVAFKFGAYFSEPVDVPCLQLQPSYQRGDCDSNGLLNITDAIFAVNHLFKGQRRWHCDDACDANDDGIIDLADALTTLNYLFFSAAPPPAPGPLNCGIDPTPDYLGGDCSQACASS